MGLQLNVGLGQNETGAEVRIKRVVKLRMKRGFRTEKNVCLGQNKT